MEPCPICNKEYCFKSWHESMLPKLGQDAKKRRRNPSFETKNIWARSKALYEELRENSRKEVYELREKRQKEAYERIRNENDGSSKSNSGPSGETTAVVPNIRTMPLLCSDDSGSEEERTIVYNSDMDNDNMSDSDEDIANPDPLVLFETSGGCDGWCGLGHDVAAVSVPEVTASCTTMEGKATPN